MSNSEVCEDRGQLVSAEDEKDFSKTIKPKSVIKVFYIGLEWFSNDRH